jgi:ferredoxin
LVAAPFAARVRIALDDEPPADEFSELDGCPAHRAVYCCGPQGLVAHVRKIMTQRGYGEHQFHSELFHAEPITQGAAFTVHAARSNVTVDVPRDETILAALERAGIAVPNSCMSGVCGTCLVPVISGEPDHRDLVQTASEKAANGNIALCCSRARTAQLTLDC